MLKFSYLFVIIESPAPLKLKIFERHLNNHQNTDNRLLVLLQHFTLLLCY